MIKCIRCGDKPDIIERDKFYYCAKCWMKVFGEVKNGRRKAYDKVQTR